MGRPRVRLSSGAGCASSWLSSSFLVTAAVLLSGAQAQVLGRWGQSTLLLNPSLSPSLLVISGKSYQAGQTINSNPSSSSSLSLSLSSPISDLSSPAWKAFGVGPTIAYGAALPLSATAALIFGGDATGDPNIALQNAADSSWILSTTSSLTPSWTHESTNWAGQPTRRQNFFSTSFMNGNTSTTWIYGGIPADGSGTPFSELWSLEMAVDGLDNVSLESGGGWIQTSTAARASAPPACYDGTAVSVPSTNGGQPSIYLIGGIQMIGQSTTISPLSTIWLYTPSASGGSWSSITARNTPTPRRGHIAVAVAGGKIWIQGGRSLDGTTVMSDGAMFDPATKAWSSTSAGGSSVWGHSAVLVGDTVVSTFGYGSNQPATSALFVYSPSNDTWLTSYVPSYAARIANPKTTSSTSSLPRVTGITPVATSSPSAKTSSAGSSSSIAPDATSLPSSSSRSSISTPILIVSILASLFVIGIIILLSIIVIRRRQRRAISRAFPSPRQNGGPANWHAQAATPGSGGSLMGEGWGAGYHVEKTVPVGKRTADGKGGILGRFFGARRSSGQGGGNDRETRFDMLRDEESDKYDSGRGRPGWKTFGAEQEEDARTELSRDWADHSEDRIYSTRDVVVNSDAYGGADLGMGDPMLTPIQEYEEEYDEEDAQYEPDSTVGHGSTSFHSHRATNSTPSHVHSNGLHSSSSPSRGHSLYGAAFARSQSRIAPRLSVSSSNHTEVPLTRSSTWWSRLNSLSSKAFPTSTSSERIRDPTPAPVLASYADTADPFLDHHETPTRKRTITFEPESQADELGRAPRNPRKDRSMSSIDSGDTASSSVMERRMRGMDVVVRLGGEGSDGTDADYTPTIGSVEHDEDTEEYRFGTLLGRSMDDQMNILEGGEEIWNGRGGAGLSDPFTDQEQNSQLPSTTLRPPSTEIKRVLGPRPLPSATSPASPVGGVRSRVLSLERKLIANEPAIKSPSATSPRGKQSDRNGSGRAGHVLAKKQALYIANPDDM